MERQDQVRQGQERTPLAERVAAMTPAEIEKVARGLGRSTIIGRQENGLPITEGGQILGELLRQNRERAEQEAA